MHSPRHRHAPLRQLASLVAGAIILWVLLASTAAQGDYFPRRSSSIARADTDSVALHQPDSLRALLVRLGVDSVRKMVRSIGGDSLLLAMVDSLAPDTTVRTRRYLSALYRRGRTASLFQFQQRSFGPDMFSGWRHIASLDSTQFEPSYFDPDLIGGWRQIVTADSAGRFYTIRERVAGIDVRHPLRLSESQYRERQLHASLDRNWRALIGRRQDQQQLRRRGGLGLSITVPGGRQSGFTTIFGKNEVDLRVNGSADIRPGFDYRKSPQQLTRGKDSQLYPSFNMDLTLGVTGTIGDKMQVSVDWDTGRSFDFENQLKLQYTGYEDEIIQSIEAGNVFLQTPSSLIRGGQSLFGLKSEIQLGGFRLTTVASQQEGESNQLSLEGGAETTEFSRRPTDYDERKHYFLSYYFRNRWEEALSSPPNIILDAVFSHVTDIEVWKLTPVAPGEQNIRQVVAMVDLGEPAGLSQLADELTEAIRPSPDQDQYDEFELQSELRDGDAVPQDYLESEAMDIVLRSSDYQVGQFKKLNPGQHYDFDEVLGYITLRQTIQESEALAVSFRYLAAGQEIQVGDFSSETGGGDNSQTGERLVLKLLKPVNLQQPANLGRRNQLNPAAWYLEMRNIYYLDRGIQPADFELQIGYEPPGRANTTTLPGITGQSTLLQVLGLDRLNEDGAENPDNLFDFLPNFTVQQGEGLLIFPYLEPFGSRMAELIDASGISEEEKDLARSQFVFDGLYRTKQINARRNTALNVYRIEGAYKGGIPSFYDLRAYSGLVEGSVRVTSGGITLAEGVDYIVDYLGGTVTITNPAHLVAGRDIDIDWEENALINLQKKTLLGARLDYSAGTKVIAGGTLMRMSQKSITDKFRIGEEPISNLIWGVDGKVDLEPRWLTRAIDALPLIQTKEPSTVVVSGEFAQLRPGHSLTNAFKLQRRELRKDGRDFYSDEVDGISYVDDFEGFENVLTLMRPGAWRLSSAPVIGEDADEGGAPIELANDTRAVLGWYQLNQSSLERFEGDLTAAVQLVTPRQIYPNREETLQTERIHPTLDLYFSPHGRGPYNYNRDLGLFLDNPRTAWGGMTQRLSEGNTDFTAKNIEFVEFVFRPFVEGGEADPDARLIVDLGRISEEVIPDNKLNTEDGLSLSEVGRIGTLARLSTGQQNQLINPIDEGERITEDLGLDGLASFPDNKFEREGGLGTEHVAFADFLNSLETTTSRFYPQKLAQEKAKAQYDPSADDYFFFLDETFFSNGQYFSGGATVQERFSRYFAGHELNTIDAQRKLAPGGDGNGNTTIPDTEDINLNSASDTDNSYFQYEVPLRLSTLDELGRPENTDDYVINEISGPEGGTGWYLVRIPVKNFTRRVGGIQDFTLMESIRIWTTGHTSPITVRFATLEFVGSQWRTSEAVNLTSADDEPIPEEDPLTGARITIESVNNEENDLYEIPNGAVRNRIRDNTSGNVRDAREQAMTLRAENLQPGRHLAVFHTYSSAQNLLKYRNLRMFLHLHGMVDNVQLQEEDRGQVKFFMRLGANETTDYYEYEQPLTPSPLDVLATLGDDRIARADYVWRTNQPNPDPDAIDEPFIDLNSVNIKLSTLNQLKFLRDSFEDEDGAPFDPVQVFWSDEHSNLQETIREFAPPGARIGVRGTPSLARVNTIVMGIRNSAGEERVLTDVNVWVNELRVSGYDEESGVAALLNADFKLADLGRLKATARMQTDGFGSLSSTLGDRQQLNVRDWTVNGQLNLDNLVPERYGWNWPVSMEVKQSSSIPRFDTNRGDIRVSSLREAVAADSTLSQEEISLRQQEINEQAQTFSKTESYTARANKSGSRSRLLRNTVDGLSFTYSFSNSASHSPTQKFRDGWRWNSTMGYRLSVRNAPVLRPLGWLDGVPVLRMLSNLGFQYLPSSFNYNLTANRTFSANRQRPDPVRQRESLLPEDIQFPIRAQHRFAHGRRFGLQYSPFGFLNLSFDANTNQSLNAIGADTLYSVILVDSLGEESRLDNTSLRSLIDAGSVDSSQIGVSAFELTDLQHIGFGRVFGRAFGGSVPGGDGVRTENYSSRASATFRPRLQRYRVLNWLQVQDFSYSSDFSWANGSVGNNTGAQAGTRVTLRGGMTVRPQTLFEKFGFYKKFQESQRAAQTAAQARRLDRQRKREQRKAERQAAREAAQAAENDTTAVEDDLQIPEPPQQEAVEDTTRRRGLRLPASLTPKALLRKLVLSTTGVQDISLTYNGNRLSNSSNVGRMNEDGEVVVHYALREAVFNGQGPSLRYRLGLDPTISPEAGRIINDRLQVSDALSSNNNYQARTTLNPSRSLRINLSWNMGRSDRENLTYRILQDGLPGADTTSSGDNRASVWAFGASYRSLFESQLELFRSDCGALCTAEGEFPDSLTSTVLTNRVVYTSFLESYVSFGSRGLLPFPLPGWNINYSGISNWPIIRRIANNATIRHSYGADFSSDFRSNLRGGQTDAFFLGSGPAIVFEIPDVEINAARINENYQPLIGLNLSFKGNVQTEIAWNKTNAFSLSTTNNVVTETRTNEVSFTASYSATRLKLPFMRSRLNNRINFSVTVSRSVNDDRSYYIRRAMEEAVLLPDFDPELALQEPFLDVLTSTARIRVHPRVSYQFSNVLSADLYVEYEDFVGDSRVLPYTNVNGGFNLRVNFSH